MGAHEIGNMRDDSVTRVVGDQRKVDECGSNVVNGGTEKMGKSV